ncbi:unnamed protein product [Paramecium octaurelia]|uniref:Uncharacterized protein n=1 Tax=Paramecium octaurelia TaxID=43137 RepID=A0A8S1T5H4_PAROT|nr:unnamed protein product [Paramecium octaurelia]
MYSYAPLGVSFASPIGTSIVRPAPVSYVQPVSYAQPIPYAQPISYVQPAPATIKGESRFEYVPYQKSVVELEEEQRVVKVPKQKWVTDYYPVEYQKEYIPQVTYEKQVDYVPVEKTVPRVDYLEREVRRSSFVAPINTAPPINYASPLSYSVAAPIAPVTTSYVAPAYSTVYRY